MDNTLILFQEKAAENGMETRDFVNLSQAELSLRLDATSLAVPNWKKGRKGKVRNCIWLVWFGTIST